MSYVFTSLCVGCNLCLNVAVKCAELIKAFGSIQLFGLSKNERPILDHHAKAHNFEIRRIS